MDFSDGSCGREKVVFLKGKVPRRRPDVARRQRRSGRVPGRAGTPRRHFRRGTTRVSSSYSDLLLSSARSQLLLMQTYSLSQLLSPSPFFPRSHSRVSDSDDGRGQHQQQRRPDADVRRERRRGRGQRQRKLIFSWALHFDAR